MNMEHRENYHGLIKQGATCYLNSVLQVLFMTREFREALNRSVDDNPNSNFIDPRLKELFEQLLHKPSNTRKILNTLHIHKVFEQQDAAEYLEKILNQTSPNAAKIFQGRMAHRTTCADCETETDTNGPFWHLPLELLNENYSVESSIKEFFKPSDFSGENQMYCERCNTKVNSTSKYVIKHHPDVLILLLKRFDFSHQSRSYVKVSCDVDVPYTLKIPQDQTYELYAVVNHFGDLRGGHYAATIKSQDDEDRWFSFDEDRVTPLSNNPFPDKKNIEKTSRAYLLFYRKKDSGLEDSVDEQRNEDHPSTKNADLQPADKERMSTNVKAKRKGLGHERCKDRVTTGESEQKKPKQDTRPIKRNSREDKTSQKEQNINNTDSDQHSQRRKSLKTETDFDGGVVNQELRNVEQNVSSTLKTQKNELKRHGKNQKNDEDPEVSERRSASERRERLTRNKAAESGEEKKKETVQTKVEVKKITETKKLFFSGKNSKPLTIKTVEEDSFFIKVEKKYNDGNTDSKSDTNTTKIRYPTSSGVDQSGSLQSDVPGLKPFSDVELEVPDHKLSKVPKVKRKLKNIQKNTKHSSV